MRLPRIYDHFCRGQIFNIEEARVALGITGNTLRKRLCELSTRGYIVQIRQGLYQLSYPADAGGGVKLSSPFAVASKVAPYCYVGFQSAMRLHAQEEISAGETIYVVSPTKFNSFAFNGNSYFWCQGPDPFGLETVTQTDVDWEFPILVTTFEKSVIDCIKRPIHAPEFNEFVRLCLKVPARPNLEKLFTFSCDCQVAALFNRVGYFLEAMKEHWDIPDDFLALYQDRMSRKLTEWPVHAFSSAQPALLSTLGAVSAARVNRWRIHFPQHLTSAVPIANPANTPERE